MKGMVEIFKRKLPVNICNTDRQINSPQAKERPKHWE